MGRDKNEILRLQNKLRTRRFKRKGQHHNNTVKNNMKPSLSKDKKIIQGGSNINFGDQPNLKGKKIPAYILRNKLNEVMKNIHDSMGKIVDTFYIYTSDSNTPTYKDINNIASFSDFTFDVGGDAVKRGAFAKTFWNRGVIYKHTDYYIEIDKLEYYNDEKSLFNVFIDVHIPLLIELYQSKYRFFNILKDGKIVHASYDYITYESSTNKVTTDNKNLLQLIKDVIEEFKSCVSSDNPLEKELDKIDLDDLNKSFTEDPIYIGIKNKYNTIDNYVIEYTNILTTIKDGNGKKNNDNKGITINTSTKEQLEEKVTLIVTNINKIFETISTENDKLTEEHTKTNNDIKKLNNHIAEISKITINSDNKLSITDSSVSGIKDIKDIKIENHNNNNSFFFMNNETGQYDIKTDFKLDNIDNKGETIRKIIDSVTIGEKMKILISIVDHINTINDDDVKVKYKEIFSLTEENLTKEIITSHISVIQKYYQSFGDDFGDDFVKFNKIVNNQEVLALIDKYIRIYNKLSTISTNKEKILESIEEQKKSLESKKYNPLLSVTENIKEREDEFKTKLIDDINSKFEEIFNKKKEIVLSEKRRNFVVEKLKRFIENMKEYPKEFKFKKDPTLLSTEGIPKEEKYMVKASTPNKNGRTNKLVADKYIFTINKNKSDDPIDKCKIILNDIIEKVSIYTDDDSMFWKKPLKNFLIHGLNDDDENKDTFANHLLGIKDKCKDTLDNLTKVEKPIIDVDRLYTEMCNKINLDLNTTYDTFTKLSSYVNSSDGNDINGDKYELFNEIYSNLLTLLSTNYQNLSQLFSIMNMETITPEILRQAHRLIVPMMDSSTTSEKVPIGTISSDIAALTKLINTYMKSNKEETQYTTFPNTNEVIIRVFTNNTMTPQTSATSGPKKGAVAVAGDGAGDGAGNA